MNINEHRKAVVRTIIRVCAEARSGGTGYNALAFVAPRSNTRRDVRREAIQAEQAEHPRGASICSATGLFFVDHMSEAIVTCAGSYGDFWIGLWLDCPLYLHDLKNSISLALVANGSDPHGNTLFPRWLAEVLEKECRIDFDPSDIYNCE